MRFRIPGTGRDPGSWTCEVTDERIEATCETAGKTEGTHCEICGKILKEQEEIPATGHTEVELVTRAATCEESGKRNGILQHLP